MLSSNTSAVSGDTTYIEDVFSTYLYTGNASTQTITNNIDLSTKGGMVWAQPRNVAGYNSGVFDTARTSTYPLQTQSTAAQVTTYSDTLTSWNNNGFTLGADTGFWCNKSGTNYASWTFRKQPKFFDIVTYTGTGTGLDKVVSHSLGSTPGCVIVKRTDTTGDWFVGHRGTGSYYLSSQLLLNSTAAGTTNTVFGAAFSSTNITLTGNANVLNGTYVAYIFAHDAGGFGLTGTDNVISCGSFTSATSTITLGYEPQWILFKATNGVGNWRLVDNMRGLPVSGNPQELYPNTSGAESSNGGVNITSTGFTQVMNDYTYIYIAIRRGPMKVPTDGTKVFAPVTRTGDGVVTTNFPVDLSISTANQTIAGKYWDSRLTMGLLQSDSTAAESAFTGLSFASNTSTTSTGFWGTTLATLWYSIRRAPSFFDEVCYTGTGVAQNISHNLGVVPEMMIIKHRNGANSWLVNHKEGFGGTTWGFRFLDLTLAFLQSSAYSTYVPTPPTASVFSVATAGTVNASGGTYVAYLFATCPGVSKVFSFTGNGSSQTINCGFTAGARFVLIKRTDSTGDWYVWDSSRGIVSGNDPHLSLNTTAAEVTTDDTIDTDSTGFIVNQLSATNVNVTSATYIGIAIA